MSHIRSTAHPGLAALRYRAPFWMPGGHLQTIWPALFSRSHLGEKPKYRRERLFAPDGDFVDVDWLQCVRDEATPSKPLLILFHGLEGSSESHYALAFAEFAALQNWDYVVPHFRGCSGELNHAPRAYHSGDYEEVYWLIRRLTEGRTAPVYAVGVSLGGNALLRWTQEMGQDAGKYVTAVAAISAPVDLAASGAHIDTGLNRQIYVRNFLATMKPRAAQKHMQFPGLFDLQAVRQSRTLYEFDNAFTAPLHGFKNTDDYWKRASSVQHMKRIRVPSLVINATNDPFVPAHCLPNTAQVSQAVQLFQPSSGGHVGFAYGRPPGHVRTLPDMVGTWFQHGL
jgi:predicted alpha/beta-fold hydrolase